MPLETPCTASSAVLQILFEEGADANARAMRERAYTTADSMTNVVERSTACRCCAFAAAAAALKQGHEGGDDGCCTTTRRGDRLQLFDAAFETDSAYLSPTLGVRPPA